MKKLLSLVLILCIIFSLAACKDTNTVEDSTSDNSEETISEQAQDNSEDNKENDSKDNAENAMVKELFGYQFHFTDEIIDDSCIEGYIAKADTYDVFVSEMNTIDFNSWDSIVGDCEELVWEGLYSGLRYSFRGEQLVSNSEKITNAYGEELLKVEGTWKLKDESYLEYIAIYYVTDEGAARVIVGVPNNGDIDTVDSAMDYIAENLQKAE